MDNYGICLNDPATRREIDTMVAHVRDGNRRMIVAMDTPVHNASALRYSHSLRNFRVTGPWPC